MSACSGWREVNLTEGIAAEKTKTSNGEETIIPDTGDYVAAVYDGNVYMGMVLETGSDDTVFISFLEHTGRWLTKRNSNIQDKVTKFGSIW